jgi:hypothetical protein
MLLALTSVVFFGSESLGTPDHTYFTVSDLRLKLSSPLTTPRVTAEVFDPASTRLINWVAPIIFKITTQLFYCCRGVFTAPLRSTTQNTPFPTVPLLLRGNVFTEPLPRNDYLAVVA